MSDKLVVEFYDAGRSQPLAVVIILHGGDNPVSASLTLASFVCGIKRAARERCMDAGEIASRLIVTHTERADGSGSLDDLDAFLIPPATDYGYQLCRVSVEDGRLSVSIEVDEFGTTDEIHEAQKVWEMTDVQVTFSGEKNLMRLKSAH